MHKEAQRVKEGFRHLLCIKGAPKIGGAMRLLLKADLAMMKGIHAFCDNKK